MPTKIIVDLATGQTTEVELEGAELEAYNASLAAQAAEVVAPPAEVPAEQIVETPPVEEAE
jgi:hypothetical protein